MAIPPPITTSAALITGASSGIGADLARGLARRGHNVILVARRRSRLDQLASELKTFGVRTEVVICDLSDAIARQQLATDIDALELTVSVLCNNAGFATAGGISDWNPERELQVFRVNIEAPVDLCARFGLGMARRGNGAILNVCSLVSFLPLPRLAAYSASKAAALAFTDVLRLDLRQYGVTVTALCPGWVRTEFAYVSSLKHLETAASAFLSDTPEFVAEKALVALERGNAMVIPNLMYRATALLARSLPRNVMLEILEKTWPAGR